MQPHVVENLLAAGTRDTVRSRSMTGKPARQLRTAWTEAWERPDAPPTAADAAPGPALRRGRRTLHARALATARRAARSARSSAA